MMEFHAPQGFRAGGLIAGLKASGRPDLALIVSERPCAAVAMFTRNRFPGAPVAVSRENIKSRLGIRAVIVNSGQANACTGREGEALARKMCEAAARRAGCKPAQALVASTGVIGRMPDLGKIEASLDRLNEIATPENWPAAAQAICTTDTKPKMSSRELKIGRVPVRILGIAKGSGMIHPSMATMLAFVMTDAPIARPALRQALRLAVDRSFHCLTVDGDTSTSDSVMLLANGAAGGEAIEPGTRAFEAFCAALTEVCRDLARAVAVDGEGATRLMTIRATGAKTEAEARDCAMAIATSNLVKCAIFGRDPNWGRLACAVGNCRAQYNPERVVIQIGPICVFDHGRPAVFEENAVHDYLEQNKEVEIHVNLKAGRASAVVWTCDLTYDYVKINAEYRT